MSKKIFWGWMDWFESKIGLRTTGRGGFTSHSWFECIRSNGLWGARRPGWSHSAFSMRQNNKTVGISSGYPSFENHFLKEEFQVREVSTKCLMTKPKPNPIHTLSNKSTFIISTQCTETWNSRRIFWIIVPVSHHCRQGIKHSLSRNFRSECHLTIGQIFWLSWRVSVSRFIFSVNPWPKSGQPWSDEWSDELNTCMSTGHNRTIGAKMPRGDLRQLYDGPEMILGI